MKEKYYSTKKFDLGSTAFRQWRASHSHCCRLHGYNLTAKVIFGCVELDERNWVADFGGFKELKQILRNQFDHTTVVALDDPELETFKELDAKNIISLRVMETGVGVEKFAEWVFKTLDTNIREQSGERVWVEQVEVFEHDINSAIYKQVVDLEMVQLETNTSVLEQAPVEPPQETPPQPGPPPKQGANVGPSTKSNSFRNPFGGTSWGV